MGVQGCGGAKTYLETMTGPLKVTPASSDHLLDVTRSHQHELEVASGCVQDAH